MKRIWNGWLKDSAFMYCVIYTIATLVNSIAYLVVVHIQILMEIGMR